MNNIHDPRNFSKHSLVLETKLLKKIINETAFAASTQESRPILTGVHFVLSQHKELKTVATDSHRLSQKKLTLEKNSDDLMLSFLAVLYANFQQYLQTILKL